MNKLLSTDHFISNHHKIQINKICQIIKQTLIGSAFFFSINLKANEIKIALLDTGFCPSQFIQSNNIKINPVIDLSEKHEPYDCKLEDLKQGRFHGQNVLNLLVDSISNQKLAITPFIVFNHKAQSRGIYFESFMKNHEKKFDIVLSAVGTLEKIKHVNFKAIWFMAAPRVSPFIKPTDQIFPQAFYRNKKYFLVGTYDSKKQIDPMYLYKKHIVFSVEELEGEALNQAPIISSSRAVGVILNKAIKICGDKIDNFSACLQSKKKSVGEGIWTLP